uniref:Angiotensin-1-converting enzyme inhibitory peptide n=1 Tax=Macrocybe gigantea TaxID=1491104 RepID=ACI_MACGN
GEP